MWTLQVLEILENVALSLFMFFLSAHKQKYIAYEFSIISKFNKMPSCSVYIPFDSFPSKSNLDMSYKSPSTGLCFYSHSYCHCTIDYINIIAFKNVQTHTFITEIQSSMQISKRQEYVNIKTYLNIPVHIKWENRKNLYVYLNKHSVR